MSQLTDSNITLEPELSLRDVMLRDHDRIERLLEALLNAFEADAGEDAARLWTQLDRALDTHFALEEQYILPWFEQVDPREVVALRAEHSELRKQLLGLGVGVDLHLTRFDMVQALVRRLRAHARREDALLYRWAEAHVHERGWLLQLARTLDALAHWPVARSGQKGQVDGGTS